MITWMILWMSQHAGQLSADLRAQTAAALENSSAWGIVWLAALSVGREGLETAVFVWATVRATADGGLWQPTLGVVSGLAVAAAIGWLVYRGTARINLGKFFTFTGYLLIVVAAGMRKMATGDDFPLRWSAGTGSRLVFGGYRGLRWRNFSSRVTPRVFGIFGNL